MEERVSCLLLRAEALEERGPQWLTSALAAALSRRRLCSTSWPRATRSPHASRRDAGHGHHGQQIGTQDFRLSSGRPNGSAPMLLR